MLTKPNYKERLRGAVEGQGARSDQQDTGSSLDNNIHSPSNDVENPDDLSTSSFLSVTASMVDSSILGDDDFNINQDESSVEESATNAVSTSNEGPPPEEKPVSPPPEVTTTGPSSEEQRVQSEGSNGNDPNQAEYDSRQKTTKTQKDPSVVEPPREAGETKTPTTTNQEGDTKQQEAKKTDESLNKLEGSTTKYSSPDVSVSNQNDTETQDETVIEPRQEAASTTNIHAGETKQEEPKNGAEEATAMGAMLQAGTIALGAAAIALILATGGGSKNDKNKKKANRHKRCNRRAAREANPNCWLFTDW